MKSAPQDRLGACKITVPVFELTELTQADDPAAARVVVLDETYYVRPKKVPDEGRRRDGKPRWVRHQFNVYPIVLDRHGAPWPEANLYVLARLEGRLDPNMSTVSGIAEDLGAFLEFLELNDIDWLHFPAQKLYRPTYRFNGHLKFSIRAGDIAQSTASSRMASVVGFYRWLVGEGVFAPENPPWKESDRYVQFEDARGFRHSKLVKTTDVGLRVPKQSDPYDGCIDDGAKLRPLPMSEQEWLVDALIALGNTEMTLIHLFSMLTGARIQTVLTVRVHHVQRVVPSAQMGDIRLPIGLGTGIDTKNGKQMVLHIPPWFLRMLSTYSASQRAVQRRGRAVGGDSESQYLFLSQRGAPLYQSKDDALVFDRFNELRHMKLGQGVRQFIKERVIPRVRSQQNASGFSYRFHDLRATAGMNWMDRQLLLVSQGKATLHEAREFVRVRMGHESSAITDRYLKYRQNLKLIRWVEEEHESHLKVLSTRAMEGLK